MADDEQTPKRPRQSGKSVTAREGYVGADESAAQHKPAAPEPQRPPPTIHAPMKPAGDTREPRSAAPKQVAPQPAVQQPASPVKRVRRSRRKPPSRAARFFLTFAVLVFVGFFAAIAVGVGAYIVIASQVPDVTALESKQSAFASTRVYDAEGGLLLELTDPNDPAAGMRQRVDVAQISAYLKLATIATEDPRFYKYNEYVGFDPIAVARVLYDAFQDREITSGGSTITQQVARNLLLSPEERVSRSPIRKIREIILANEITRRYPRDQILGIYLNEINYANLAYGAEAASRAYFNKPAKDLTLGEASLLAGIPQSPVLWDPVANKDNALKRQAVVLRLMAEAGFIQPSEIEAAQAEMRAYTFRKPRVNVPAVAPHFFYFVREQLAREYGDKGLFRRGLRVYTSLNPIVQRVAEDAVRAQLDKLKDKNVTNAAVVVLKPETGEILAMVGSADFYNDAINGQVNIAISPQQPGSSVKPFTFLGALEKGQSPSTVYWDVQRTYTNQYGQTFTPRNYDGKFHGPMSMREALARSINIPAVDALEYVGMERFLELTNKVGIDFPPNPQYGLALTLGGGDSTLLNLTEAYGVLANNGVHRQPTAITRVESLDGALIRDYTQTPGEQVVQPEHAYLITHMLSDNAARSRTFGRNNVLNLPFPAAAKTGTTNDFRDNLTMGYAPGVVVGVWVGNTDNSEMQGVSGITGAAPIWREVMLGVSGNQPPRAFVRPPGIVEAEVCADGGRLPSPACRARVVEIFKADQPPLPPDEALERAVAAGDPRLAQAPPPAAAAAQSVDIQIMQPAEGAQFTRGLLSIQGTVNPAGFREYVVEYGDGDNPGEWRWISGPHQSPVVQNQLTQWGLESLAPGRYTLRITVQTTGAPIVGYSRFDVLP
jgi:penicillin-binding protein 1C